MSAQYGDTRNGYAASATATATHGPNVRRAPGIRVAPLAGTGVPQRLGDRARPDQKQGHEGEEANAVRQTGDLVAEQPRSGQRFDDAEQRPADQAQPQVLEPGEHPDHQRFDLE